MKFFDRALLAQVAVVVCRPLVFIWSVAQISNIAWAGLYLFALGLMPLFAVIDVFFQSVARHSFIGGAKPQRVAWPHLLWALGVLVIAIVGVLRSNSSTEISGTMIALVAIYFSSAFFNKFEASISSSNAVLGMAITELLGYFICAFVAFACTPFVAAILATMVFPSARIVTVILNQRSDQSVRSASSSAPNRTVFVGSAVSSQVFASLAAGAPSIVSIVTPGALDRIGAALITLKVVFAVSALWSTVVNILGIRVFYGVLSLELGPRVVLVRVCETALFIGLPFGVFIALASLPYFGASVLIFSILLCVAFSYLNLLSSLAIMRGSPFISALAQAAVCVGAFSLAFLMNEKVVYASVSLLLFIVGFYVLSRHARVSVMLGGR